jgi:hypothetical protein
MHEEEENKQYHLSQNDKGGLSKTHEKYLTLILNLSTVSPSPAKKSLVPFCPVRDGL